jgi:hypothetical protein
MQRDLENDARYNQLVVQVLKRWACDDVLGVILSFCQDARLRCIGEWIEFAGTDRSVPREMSWIRPYLTDLAWNHAMNRWWRVVRPVDPMKSLEARSVPALETTVAQLTSLGEPDDIIWSTLPHEIGCYAVGRASIKAILSTVIVDGRMLDLFTARAHSLADSGSGTLLAAAAAILSW